MNKDVYLQLLGSTHTHTQAVKCCCSSSPAAVSYLEQGAVALQTGGAQGGDGAQTAPEVDARQQGAVGQQQAGGGLGQGGCRESVWVKGRRAGAWKNTLTEQEGSLWFPPSPS